ncbi:hypothetical protein SKAU_G00182780 [Synaphobranchus kaupii]|uniref:C2H2-type domain-containing protein n=1 Tax=Synaphobranchus kaupii TaxID=118154 RepID=A0A9Q1FC29_SYNKA|nr:hypothetical protein SKAU_G00182780 [Synaphobranchus kaupii]
MRQKGQVVTRKRKRIGQLERPLKLQTSSSENGICAASHISPVIPPRNQNTGQTGELASQVFSCSQCPFVHTEEVNLHQHIEKVHPEELNRTVRSQQSPSSTHQHPTPPEMLPMPAQSHTGTPGAHTCPQCGKSFKSKSLLKKHKKIHIRDRPFKCSQCEKSFNSSPMEAIRYAEGKIRATLPAMDECKFFSMPRPPLQRVVDSTKLTNTNSQSDSMSNSITYLSTTSSGEDIMVESVMDSSDYTEVEPRDMGARSPWRRHELSPLRGNGSLRQKKGQPVTRKRKRIGQLERPLKLQTSSSENGICTESSLCSPITPSRNQDTGQTVEMSSQVFGCSQCPFVHTEVNLHQHIEKVHAEELSRTLSVVSMLVFES